MSILAASVLPMDVEFDGLAVAVAVVTDSMPDVAVVGMLADMEGIEDVIADISGFKRLPSTSQMVMSCMTGPHIDMHCIGMDELEI
jgi:hypothetical protein